MDRKCIISIRMKKNLLVVWYLIYQYSCHVMGVKILSDRVYRVVRSNLIWEWEDIDHALIHLLDKEDVLCDIIFSRYADSYPKALVTCGNLYIKEYHSRRAL